MLAALSPRRAILLYVGSFFIFHATVLRSQSPEAAVAQEEAASVEAQEDFSQPEEVVDVVPSFSPQSDSSPLITPPIQPGIPIMFLGGEIQMEPGFGANTTSTCQNYVSQLEAYVKALEAKLAECQCNNPSH